MKLLVTGGTGYIGSHTCVALLAAGHDVIVADDLRNSRMETLERIEQITKQPVLFYKLDVTNAKDVEPIFAKHRVDGVMHFAGLKAVGESVGQPLAYYYNNLVSTIVLAQACVRHDVSKFVFSSSATVYGNNQVPFHEGMALLPATNPYGESKAVCERILLDTQRAHPGLSVTVLRYFNPVGAHESGAIGETPNGIPNNIMPFITQVARGTLKKLLVFGGDYPTADGTGVRDYIHVMDLAEGHVAALHHLTEGAHVYNLGTGQGTSVMQLIQAFEQASGVQVPYEIVARRSGDIAACYADTRKANHELQWRAQRGLVQMCEDAWRFEVHRGR
jgi:UDP-glucose 4-epimerase